MTHATSAGQLTHVMTWNVQRASAERGTRQAAWLSSRPEADVVALTEVSGGAAGEHLQAELSASGYQTYMTAGSDGDYRVLLGARVGELETVALTMQERPHRMAAATLVLPNGLRVALVGLYVPSRGPKKQRNVAKRAFQKAVAGLLLDLPSAFTPGVPIVVAGDLNVIEPGHYPSHTVFGQWEYEFYEAFAASGFVDAFRDRQPDTIDHSWYGRSGSGYRFDHLFCSAAHISAVRSCKYMHEPRLAKLSDHAALTAQIQLYPAD